MTYSISLLGKPHVEEDGIQRQGPKGRKPWALLAYLLLSDGPHTRQHLANFLFSQADDPLGSVRWNLAQLRRLLGMPESLRGQEVTIRLPPATVVDVHVLTSGTWTEAINLGGLAKDLLEGTSFPSDPAFETWLMLERTRLNSVSATVLREAAAACLGTGKPDLAAQFASRFIALEPFDEAGHELLIRSYSAVGQQDHAEEALRKCIEFFRSELGTEPGAAVKSAVRPSRMEQPRGALSGSVSIRAQIDLGQAAIKAGAVDTGLESLRAAVAGGQATDEDELQAAALLALGHALVHSVRGRDGEASAVLHRALEISSRAGLLEVEADCNRELGYIEMLNARYERALIWLEHALDLSTEDVGARAWTLAYQAICYSDTGRYSDALDRLGRCLQTGEEWEIPNQTAYALCLLGRIQLLRGEQEVAKTTLQRSLAVAKQYGWTSFVPWPAALLADVEILQGDEDGKAKDRLGHALSLAQRIGDPCWEGATMRGLGLIDASKGEIDVALERFQEATLLCVKFPDGYLWMQAYALDALCALATQEQLPTAGRWISDLESLAARTGMKEMLARAYLYRARLGEAEAAATAWFLVQEVDNPALTDEIARFSEK